MASSINLTGQYVKFVTRINRSLNFEKSGHKWISFQRSIDCSVPSELTIYTVPKGKKLMLDRMCGIFYNDKPVAFYDSKGNAVSGDPFCVVNSNSTTSKGTENIFIRPIEITKGITIDDTADVGSAAWLNLTFEGYII